MPRKSGAKKTQPRKAALAHDTADADTTPAAEVAAAVSPVAAAPASSSFGRKPPASLAPVAKAAAAASRSPTASTSATLQAAPQEAVASLSGEEAAEHWRKWEVTLAAEAAQALESDEPVDAPSAQAIAHWRDGAETLPRPKEDGALPAHCCPDVLQADINRSMFHVPEGPKRRLIRRQLCDVIVRALCDERWHGEPLHYYQGVHDVVAVVLDAAAHEKNDVECMTEAEVARLALAATSLLHSRFRRFAKKDMQATLGALKVMFQLVASYDAEVAARISAVVGSEAHFAMSWMITWFAHELQDAEHGALNHTLVAVFDDLIAQPDEFGIVFLCAAVILKFGPVLMDAHPDWTGDDSFGEAYQALKHLPRMLLPGHGGEGASNKSGAAVLDVLHLARQLREQHGDRVVEQLTGEAPRRDAAKRKAGVAKLLRFVVWTASVTVTLVAMHIASQPLETMT